MFRTYLIKQVDSLLNYFGQSLRDQNAEEKLSDQSLTILLARLAKVKVILLSIIDILAI